MEKRNVVIVDAYSSGNLIAPEFNRRGCNCIHVQTKSQIPKVVEASFDRNDFSRNIIYDDDFKKIVNILKVYKPISVIAGTETGVVFADRLGKALCVRGNSYETSDLRRDKYLMQEAIRQRNLRAIEQIQTNDACEAESWASERWPVVVKPLNSAGTDNVVICKNAKELLNVFNSILGKENQIGFVNKNLLIQEYIKGTEYIVDTVSYEGKHYVTDIWKYHKISNDEGSFIYDVEELLHPEGKVQDMLEEYTFSVLDAIGIQYGVAHNEVMVDTKGPILIESGARLNGGGVQPMIDLCTNANPVELLADVHLSPDKLINYFGNRYKIRKYGLYVYFIAETEGVLQATLSMDDIYKLDSFSKLYMNVKIGEKVQYTRDLFTSPGHVELINKNRDILWKDYEIIRYMEKEGLFEIK